MPATQAIRQLDCQAVRLLGCQAVRLLGCQEKQVSTLKSNGINSDSEKKWSFCVTGIACFNSVIKARQVLS